jgi:cytochrome c oxidase subunit 2
VIDALVNTRSQYDGLATLYLWIAGAVFAIVAGSILLMLARYRAGRDPDRLPSRRHGHRPSEIAYVVLLVLITAFLVTMTFRTESRIDDMNVAQGAPSTLHVDVVGAQWVWRFRYRGTPTVEQAAPTGVPTKLYVPVGRPVAFTGRSQDVLHDFWIPDLKFQRQVWPDHTERWTLVFPRAGTFMGICAWFCGLYHDSMHFEAIALPARQFDAWLARRRQEARP